MDDDSILYIGFMFTNFLFFDKGLLFEDSISKLFSDNLFYGSFDT